MSSKTKKLFSVMAALGVVLSITGCARGGGTQPVSTAPQSDSSGSAVAAAPDAPASVYTIKVGHVVDEENSLHKGFVIFKEYVEKESGGRLAVEIYPNALLGGDRELVEGVELGTFQMTAPASTVLVTYAADMGILDMPFLFSDAQAGFRALDGALGEKLDKIIREKVGVMNLGYGYNGARAVSNNVRPIKQPSDLNGIKIRVMESPIYIDTFKALGANPTPMSFGEVFTALQQGTVDGQDNAATLTVSSRFSEVQKYYTNLGHTQSFMPMLINVDFFEGLPAELQTIVRDGVKVGLVDAQRSIEIEDRDTAIQAMIDSGTTQVDEVTPENYSKFVAAVQSVYEKNKSTIDPALFDLAQSFN